MLHTQKGAEISVFLRVRSFVISSEINAIEANFALRSNILPTYKGGFN